MHATKRNLCIKIKKKILFFFIAAFIIMFLMLFNVQPAFLLRSNYEKRAEYVNIVFVVDKKGNRI